MEDELLKVGLIIGLHLTGSVDETWKLTNEMHIQIRFLFPIRE